MASIGPNNGNTFASDSLVGTIAIVNPSNAQLSDDAKATAILLLGEVTQYLKATDFRLRVPLHSKIDGIVVEIERSSTVLSSVADNIVKLYLPDNTLGVTNQASGTNWPTSDAYATYGSSSDTWGQALNPLQVNNANFGIVISATAALANTISIDHVRLTVHFTQFNMPHNMQRVIQVGNGMSRNERAS